MRLRGNVLGYEDLRMELETLLRVFAFFLVSGAIALRIALRPEELAVFALILYSTFPAVTDSSPINLGSRGFTIRPQHIVLFLGVLLAFLQKRESARVSYRSYLRWPVLIMLFIHLLAIPVAMYWNTGISPQGILTLLPSFLYFFIFTRLTRVQHIPKLVNAYILVGVIVSAGLLVTTLWPSSGLFAFVNSVPSDDYTRFSYYAGERMLRVWLSYADGFLYVAGAMALVLLLTKPERQLWYGAAGLLILLRALVSGQRSFPLMTVGAYLLVVLLLVVARARSRSRLGQLVVLAVILGGAYLLVITVPALAMRWEFLQFRAGIETGLELGRGLPIGTRLAWQILSDAGVLAWLTGLGGFQALDATPGGFDITTPLLMVFRFGFVGALALLFLLMRALGLVTFLLRRDDVTAAELAVAIGIGVKITIGLLESMLRTLVFSENFSYLAGFVILLSWAEVIYRDRFAVKAHPNPEAPAAGRTHGAISWSPYLAGRNVGR